MKHEIDITVKGRASEERTSAAMKSREMRAARAGTAAPKADGRLADRLSFLGQKLDRLGQAIERNTRAMSRGGRGAGGSGGTAVGTAVRSAAGGGGLGRIGAAMPLGFGIPVALMGMMIKSAISAGRAAMDLSLQQAETAGIAGFQKAGIGTYTPTEAAQFKYARRMAAGTVAGGSAADRNLALKYGRMTGLGAGGIGTLMGGADVSRGQGGQDIVRAISRLRGNRVSPAELRPVLEAMSGALQDAVSGGIADADLAGDMSRQIAVMARFGPEGTGARTALAVRQSFAGEQRDIGTGRFEGMRKFRLLRAGMKVAGTERGLAVLKKSALFRGASDEQIREALQNPVVMRQAGQIMNERAPGMVQQEFSRGFVRDFGPSGGLSSDPATRIRQEALLRGKGQAVGLFGGLSGAQQGMLIRSSSAVARPGMERGIMEREAGPKGTLKTALDARVMKQEAILGLAGKFIPGVVSLDRSFIKLAKEGTRLTGAFNALAKGTSKAVDGMSKMVPYITGEKSIKDLMPLPSKEEVVRKAGGIAASVVASNPFGAALLEGVGMVRTGLGHNKTSNKTRATGK